MKLPLYERVSVNRDVLDQHLRAGDVVTLVDYVPHPHGGEEGCIVEVFNALGQSIGVKTVPNSAIAPLRADEVLAVRPLVRAG